MGQSRPLFVYFRPFRITISIIQIEKSLDGVLGIQTHGCRMVGTDKAMELWRLPNRYIVKFNIYLVRKLISSLLNYG